MIRQTMDQKNQSKQANRKKSKITKVESHRAFRKNIKGKKTLKKYDVDSITYNRINLAFNGLLIEKLLEGRTVSLPAAIGELTIFKRRIPASKEYRKMDYGHWRKTGEVKFHLNEHSDYMYAFTVWNKGVIKNALCFEFEPCRYLSRSLAKRAKENKLEQYIEKYR